MSLVKLLGTSHLDASVVAWLQSFSATTSSQEFAGKAVLIGSASTGKTCVLGRFASGTFNADGYRATIGVDFFSARFSALGGSCSLDLQLWDTAGEERFQAVTKAFFRGAAVIVVCFDLSSEESFEAATRCWAPMATEAEPRAHRIFAGLKSDLFHAVSRDRAELAAGGAGRYFECSARDDVGVNELFSVVASRILNEAASRVMQESKNQGTPESSAQVVSLAERPQQKGSVMHSLFRRRLPSC